VSIIYFETDTGLKVPTVSTDTMRMVDAIMVDTYHIELLQMMENAGRNLADFAVKWFAQKANAQLTIAILVGSGGNGGGGLVATRHLLNRGHRVYVICATPVGEFTPVTKQQAEILFSMGASITDNPVIPESDIIIDCLLGYSLNGNPQKPFATLIESANHSQVPIMALDTPSGLDVTSGVPHIPCIKAAATMTLALPKAGFLTPAAQTHLGELYLADISVPPSLYQDHLALSVSATLFAETSVIKLMISCYSN